MKDYLKIILVALALVSVGAGLYLGYQFIREHPFYSRDDELAELEKAERAKDYPLLINLLYKQRESTAFSEKVLPWLKKREGQGFAPYLYATALHLVQLGKPEEAVLYYFRAGLIARVDLLRCMDSTAEGIVMQLEQPFKDVQEYLTTHPGTKVSAGTLALLKEEETFSRAKPDWLCAHGEKKLNPFGAYIDDELWLQRRKLTRDSFRFMVSERPDKFENPPAELLNPEAP